MSPGSICGTWRLCESWSPEKRNSTRERESAAAKVFRGRFEWWLSPKPVENSLAIVRRLPENAPDLCDSRPCHREPSMLAAKKLLRLIILALLPFSASLVQAPAESAQAKPDQPVPKVYEVPAEGLTIEGELARDGSIGDDGRPYQMFTVKFSAGQSYVLALDSFAFDAGLMLRSKNGEVLALDDNSGGDLNA